MSIPFSSAGNHSASKQNEVSKMIKSVFAAVAAAPLFAGAALAGPYVNVEANSGFTGSDYTGTTTDAHVGYAGEAGESVSWYVQGGPSFVSPDGADGDTVLSGKAGASVAATDALSVYGEVSFATGVDDADTGYGTKIGATWSF
jgi:hypothetical protein